MVAAIGVTAGANIPGKQVALSAQTTANQAAGYVFTTASTAMIGDATVTKRTGAPGSSLSNPWADPSYDATKAIMTFNGNNQAVAYSPTNAIQVAPLPFSFQIDFNTTKNTGDQYIMNMGQGNSVGWPCLHTALTGTQLYVSIGTKNDGTGITSWTVGNVQINQWYRVGIMIYRVDTNNYLRYYLNGEVKVQVLLGTSATNTGGQGGIPRTIDTSGLAGIAFGADNANTKNYNFQGQLRNIFLDNVLFWPI